jgi:NDP-sugar pyrophosphorylase family protein
VQKAGHDELADYFVLILAGGLGTRLRPIYDHGTKAMAPIAGTPFLEYLLRVLERAGFRKIVLCVGYRYQEIRDQIGDGTTLGLKVHYSVEHEPLGTGGALRLGAAGYAPRQCFFCMNGDSYLDIDYSAMLNVHKLSNARATLALATARDSSRYGTVTVDEGGWVQDFREKTRGDPAGLVNAGIYIFEPEIIDLIPERRNVSLERHILPRLASEGLNSYSCGGYFLDIGTPEDFLRAQIELKEFMRR